MKNSRSIKTRMRDIAAVTFVAFATVASGQSKQESALSVMNNARAICSFNERAVGLLVTCPNSLPRESRFKFATAIANADAALSGRAKRIDFRLKSGEPFAEADPQTGIREVARSQSTPRSPAKGRPVIVGTLADTVLELRGKASSVRQVGRDENGLLVEWRYPDVTYLMGRRLQGVIEAYRVIKITPRQ